MLRTHISKIISILTLTLTVPFFSACNNDEPNPHYSDPGDEPSKESPIDKPKLSAPDFRSDISQGVFDGVYFRCRFGNGEDTNSNMSCTVHWRRYYDKPSTHPTKNDMLKHDNMRLYEESRESVVFEKAHAGAQIRGWLYYYFECTNSYGTTESDICTCYVRKNY